MAGGPVNGGVSFWYADMGGLPAPRAPLAGDATADVCIVGAGYTGLYAAYYLKQADPALQIVIAERDFAGFGASGRNGGWLSGGFAWNRDRYLAGSSRDAVRGMIRAMAGTVDEVIRLAEAEGIAADILRTDELLIGTNPAQIARLNAEYAVRTGWDVPEDRVRMLGQAETRARVNMAGALGALEIAGVARVQPAMLVQGLARAVERLGVRIVETTPVTQIDPGRVTTARGIIRAPVILRATEGFSAGLPGARRDWLALNSAQVVTEPLPQSVWDEIGWQGHEIVGDYANGYCYAQRTREGRIAMGGRGVPYRLGNRSDARGQTQPETVARLTDILHRHFPATRSARIDHAWCGVLGVPRDWCATVGLNPATGIGWAGGYVGIGVSTSNLAGRTLADLVLRRDTELVRLPWVNRRVRKWEPEPLRWLGVHGMYALLAAADRREAHGTARTSRLATFGNWLTGR